MVQSSRPHRRPAPDKLQRILRHAALVFSSKGYDGASIRDISRSSGVSLSGLYYYAESKQKILYLIQYHTFKTVLDRARQWLEGVADARERLRILVRNHVDFFLSHPVEMKVLTHEDEALEGIYRGVVAAMKRHYYGLALGIFEELRKSGAVRRIEPRVAVLSLFGMMNWIHTWHRKGVDPQAEELADAIADIFLRGVMHRPDGARSKLARVAQRGLAVAARTAQ